MSPAVVPKRSRMTISHPAMPPMCPKHRSRAVSHGQQGSVTAVAKLHHRKTATSATVLPKLAVNRALVGAESVLDRSREDPSGYERSRPICKNRRSEGVHTRLRAGATLLGMQDMSVPSSLNEG